MTRKRRHAAPVQVGGADLDRALAAARAAWTERLVTNDAAPAAVSVDGRTVVFSFWTPFRAARAAELLGGGGKFGAQQVYARAAVLAEAEAEVGATPPTPAQRVIDQIIDRLTRNDAAPATWRYDEAAGERVVTFYYHTPFRRDRAAELTSPTYAAGATGLRVKHALARDAGDDAAVGAVAATPQATPWTCGPAALRAVLAHHGIEVGEDAVATLAGNVPVIGCRPSGLVQAATELGCRADVFQARDLAALAPLLAADLPVLIVVDSWTHPGKAGHWVVVTLLGPRRVRVMDPHVAGCFRDLTPAELEARWWHREDGGVVKHLALLVTPEPRFKQPLVDCAARGAALARGARWHRDHVSRNDALAGEIGKDAEPPPAHGRLAKCTGSKWDTVGEYFGKAWRAVMKTMISSATGGGAGGKLGGGVVDAWADKFHIGVKDMKAEERRGFFNNASNAELVIWSIGWARAGYDKLAKDHGGGNDKKAWRFVAALGITGDDLRGEFADVMRATLKTVLWYGAWAPMSLPPCVTDAVVQAYLILDYGPLAETWEPIVKKKRTLPKGDSYVKIPAWVNAIMADLDAYKAARAGDDEPAKDFA